MLAFEVDAVNVRQDVWMAQRLPAALHGERALLSVPVSVAAREGEDGDGLAIALAPRVAHFPAGPGARDELRRHLIREGRTLCISHGEDK